MSTVEFPNKGPVGLTGGVIDYVDAEGVLHLNAPMRSVMIAADYDPNTDEDGVLADYGPGTVAFAAGWTALYQKAADGTWVDALAVPEAPEEETEPAEEET